MGKYLSSTVAVLMIASQLMIPFAFAGETEPAVTIYTSGTVTRQPSSSGVKQSGPSNSQLQQSQQQQGSVTIRQNSQAQGYNNGVESQGGGDNPVGEALGEAIGCSAGQILGNIVQAGVSGIINEVKNGVTNLVSDKVTGTVTGQQYVPTDPKTIVDEVKNINKDQASQTSKDVKPGNLGLLDSLTEAIDGISWDSVGFCLANATIRYFTQATVNWINSGFKDNPVFVDNPAAFFQDLADIELGGLIDELGLGFLCSGNLPKVRIALVNDYLNRNGGRAFSDRYKCSFDQIGANIESFKNDFRNGGINAFVEYTFNPSSRVTTGFLVAQDELGRRIADKQYIAQFELRTSDWLNFKKCDTAKNPKTQREEKVNCRTYTLGQMAEEAANNAINSPRNRLEFADEFDEVVAALVTQLLRSALSEISSIGESSGDDISIDGGDDDGGDSGFGSVGNGYVPAPAVPVSGTCRVSTTTVAVDEPVEFSVVPRGGNRVYTYDWLGASNFPTSTRLTSLIISFGSTTDASDIKVRVRSAGKAAVVNCPDVRVTPAIPLEVSCKPDDSSVNTGETVTWLSEVSGGNGFYQYEWSGDVSDFGKNDQDNSVTYFEDGKYNASLKVISGSQVKTAQCGQVKVK